MARLRSVLFGASLLLAPLTHSRSIRSLAPQPLPLVIWHGLGDNFENEGLQGVADLAEQVNPGTKVYLIRLGEDSGSDRTATFWGNVTEQLDEVCTMIAEHPDLGHAPAINGLGFSQGGQFLRGYVERCNAPRVANLVTFGSQHNGIAEFQDCADGDWWCRSWQGVLRSNTWSDFVQRSLVPAQYFRDPEELDNYLEHSNFLADINNERDLKNQAYKDNIKELERFVMYLFRNDTVVVPKETGWFAEVNRTSGVVTPLKDRTMYKEDWLGLRYLDEQGRLEFKTTEGEHMRLSDEVLTDVFRTYFAPPKSKPRGKLSWVWDQLSLEL